MSIDPYARSLVQGVPAAPFVVAVRGVNLNAVADTAAPVALPSGFTRYLVTNVIVSNASTSLTTAKAGVYTAAAAGGVAIVPDTTALSGITADTTDTAANAAALAPSAAATEYYDDKTLYIHVGTAQGAAATADFTIVITPLS